MGDERDPEQRTYDVFLEERRALNEAANSESQLFDRSAVTISTGALVLSITFVGQIVGSRQPVFVPLLWLSWFLLVAALLAILLSLRFSVHAHERQQKILDEQYMENKFGAPARNPWGTSVEVANWTSMVCLVVGLAALAAFAAFNVGRNDMSKGSGRGSPPSRGMANDGMRPIPTTLQKGIKPPSAPLPMRPSSPGAGKVPAAPPPPPPTKK